MNDFEPYISADGSLGLYSKDFGDIYHSVSGAVTESLEKFVYPIDFDILLKYNEIKILDLCFGIGYNSKTFLNYLYQNRKNFLNKKKNFYNSHANCYDAIHTDNINNQKQTESNAAIYTDNVSAIISCKNTSTNTETIYSDKIFNKIFIHAVDNDKILPYISPFIKSDLYKYRNIYKLPDKKYNKYFFTSKKTKFKINNLINYIIFNSVYAASELSDDVIKEVGSILNINKDIFASDLYGIFKNSYLCKDNNYLFSRFNSNLHNIYYRYISNRYKKAAKSSKIGNIDIKLSIDDARNVVRNDNLSYNLIFLDAFSPSKCPCLWSYEFFKELFRLLSDDGMLLTYSTSASVRSAMYAAGFSVGYTYDQNMNQAGTVCAKNSSLIKHPLCDFDLGLLKTRAGIFYRDKNLTGQNEAIIALHDFEVKNSERISTTNYIKQHKKEDVCMM